MEDVVVYTLGLASIAVVITALWYLFQTVKIMWGYSALLAIAAVIFSPLIHIVFYLIPKDGFDDYEKSMFKRYFLSIAAIAILGIFSAIAIPSLEDTNQDAMANDTDTSQPWEWDIRAEDQEAVSALSVAETNEDKAAKLHYDAIYQAHPDVQSVMQSSDFNAWLQGQPTEKRDDIERMLEEGTATEVIYVFSSFKQDLSNYRSYEYQAKRNNAQIVAERGYQEREKRDLESAKSSNQKYYDDQSKQRISEYTASNYEQPLPIVQEAPISPKPSPPAPIPIAASAPSQIVNCDGAGCWGTDGTRYNKGAGDTYFPSTGGSCQNVGGQMQCN